MADFRRSLALAGLALALGVGTASAQVCNGSNSQPPVLRAESKTELVGQIILNCNGLPALTSVNIVENLPAPVSLVTQAFLVVSGNPVPYAGVISSTSVTFNGVTVPAGAPTITIGGIRIDDTTIAQTGGFTPVSAQLAVSNGVLPLQSALYTVGFIEPSLTVTSTPSTIVVSGQCTATPTTVSISTSTAATLTISENFATALKKQLDTTGGDSESGSYVGTVVLPGTTGPTSIYPIATSGTEIAVSFANIPAGVTLYVPVTVPSSTNAAVIAMVVPVAAGAVGGGNPTFVVGTPNSAVPPTQTLFAITSASTVYYDVITSAPTSNDVYNIPVYAAGPLVAGATATVALSPSFTGNSSGGAPNAQGIFPNFVSAPSAAQALFGSVTPTPCQTSLLFPFLTNQAGFDTGLSIAYTAKDPFATPVAVAAPSCALNLYGANAPTTAPTLAIPVGGEGHTTISAAAPNFQGYGIAVCNFNYAHGYAFITDGFLGPGKGLSEGYVANVLTNTTRPGTSSVPGASTSGAETLSH